MEELDFSAFEKRTANVPVKELLITGFCLMLGIFLFLFVLDILRDTYNLGDWLVSKLNAWIGGPIIFGVLLWMLARTLAFSRDKKNNLFKEFAKINGFICGGNDPNLEKTRLLDFGSTFTVRSPLYLHGSYGVREFKLNLVTIRRQGFYGNLPHFYGAIKLTLNHSYSHDVFKYPELPQGFTVPAGIGRISTEIIGNHLYFLRDEGFDMTPQGMANIFKLIKQVDAIDPPS